VAHQVHQIGRILAIVNGERAIEADALGELTNEARADGMERSGPREAAHPQAGRHMGSRSAIEDALGAPFHLGGGAAREGQQQDAMRVGTAHHEVRDPVRQRVGLARARPRDHQQRPRVRAADAVLDRRALVRIELFQIGGHANQGWG
jgi:hypothetical protein